MPRRNFLARFAYDGSDFLGWQRLPAGRTVQAEIEKTLGAIVGAPSPGSSAAPFAPPFEIIGASRTDAGVHAEGQAASFHARTELVPERIAAELNSALPPDIACLSCVEVDPRFHARYRARGKLYRYRLCQSSVPDPFARRYSLWLRDRLDVAAMERAASLFEGQHDFGAFTNAHPAGAARPAEALSPDGEGQTGDSGRSIESFRIEENGAFIDLLVKGPGFLYNQVRLMAAAIVEVGRGKLKAERIAAALKEGSPARQGMPGALGPYGLCLVQVFYQNFS